MEKLLTVDDLCELLQVKRSTVYDWTHTGYIPHYKFKKVLRFKEDQIQRWLNRKRKKGMDSLRQEIEGL